MDKVCIFMSTYNGQKYLNKQIDSILQQNGVEVTLYIRDDGSTDNTVQIIEEYLNQGRSIVMRRGENVGFQKSFALISHEYVKADYYAFADQDDVWNADKLIHAIGKLKTIVGPVLYGGNIFITDAKLQNETKWAENNIEFAYKENIIQNCYAFGYNMYACSMVWNRELQAFAERHMPKYFVSQDVYLTMLAGAVGHLLVDDKPMIWHRLHDNNTAGIENNIIKKFRKGYQLYLGKHRRRLSRVAKEIIENYSNQIDRKKRGIDLLYYVAKCPQSWKMRWHLINSAELKQMNGKSRFCIVSLIITNRL